MSSKTFRFQDQLRVGDIGEKLFIDNYPSNLEIYEGREWDFNCLDSGKRIEIKADTYDVNKTENFFFEYISNDNKGTPGGPWRAKKDKVDIFCYVFVKNGYCYEFGDVRGLIKRLDWLIKDLKEIKVKNPGYMTIGYKVPRSEVEDLYHLWKWQEKE